MTGVLVLGAGGFIGGATVAGLARAGHAVHAYGRARATAASVPGVIPIQGSIEDAALLREALAACERIVYAASLTTPGTSARDPALEVVGNLLPLARVLECSGDFPRRHVVYLSSAGTIYGDVAQCATESVPPRPRSYYGAGKAAAEALLHACTATTDWTATILRPSNLYGPGQVTTRGFAIVPTLFERALDGAPFRIWGDGSAVRDYCYVDDLVDAIRLTLDDRSGCTIYNVASGCAASVLELVAACERASGRPIAVEYAPARGVDAARVVPDSTRLRDACGWTPRVDLDAGLARTWRWTLDARGAIAR